jgi:hypothetical protein
LSSDDGRTWIRGCECLGNVSVSNVGSTFEGVDRAGVLHSADGQNWRGGEFVDDDAVMSPYVPGVGVWMVVRDDRSHNGIWFSADGVRWERRATG